jgi:hypothetical protein
MKLQVLPSRRIHGKSQHTSSIITLMHKLDHRAILHDPVLYSDPFKFKPERFLDARKENVAFAQQSDPTIAGTSGYGQR